MNSEKRKSNIELLRIISLLLIVAHHFSFHGGFDNLKTSIVINDYWIKLLSIVGKVGVNIFIFITGYFLINSNKIKISKLFKLILQILTYSLLTFLLGVVFKITPFSIKGLISHIFPITYGIWWFVTTYIVLYLLSPYINKLLNSLTKEQYKRVLVLITIIWCVIPTLTARLLASNELLWFIYIYSLAGYIRKFPLKKQKPIKYNIFIAVAFTLLTLLSSIVIASLGPSYSKFVTYFYGMQKLPILIISLNIFAAFLKKDIKYNKIINLISSTTFGIYLLHDSEFGRSIFWVTLFKNSTYYNKLILIPHSLLAILSVFVMCSIVEMIRIYVFEKRYMKSINTLSEKFNNLIEKIFSIRTIKKL